MSRARARSWCAGGRGSSAWFSLRRRAFCSCRSSPWTLTFLVVAAFGAAALGQFRSLPGTYLGGLAIGVGAALATKYFTTGLLSGLSASLPFLVLFVVLMVSPRRRLADPAPVVPRRSAGWTAPWQAQAFFGSIAAVFLLLVPGFAGIHLADWSRFLALTILFLSLGLLVRTSGQVSLCQVSFMAIGACAFSHLAVDHGWPWGLALLGAGVIAVPIGALLAIPAIRLPGLYLALATFGFGILLQYMFYSQSYMFGNLGLGVRVPMPVFRALGLTQSDKSYYYLCLALAVVVTVFVIAVGRSRLGRLLRALSDSPTGLAASGASTNVTRLLVFCISAFLAAIAGVLEAGAIGTATDASYQPITSLVFFALIIISLGGAPWYAIGAAVGSTLIASYWTNANASNWLQVVFGLSALIYSITPASAKGTPPRPGPARNGEPRNAEPRNGERSPGTGGSGRRAGRAGHPRRLRRAHRRRRRDHPRAGRTHHGADRAQRRREDDGVQQLLGLRPSEPRQGRAQRT
jgi:ABC-type branched-subunit amino acid transport system permease subunit